jgi:hypothetical protein
MSERPLSTFAYSIQACPQEVRGAGGVLSRNLRGAEEFGIQRFSALWFIVRLVRIDFAVFQCRSPLGTKTTTSTGNPCLDQVPSDGATERSFLNDDHHLPQTPAALPPPNDLTGQKRQLGSAAPLHLDAALCTTPEKRKEAVPRRPVGRRTSACEAMDYA